MAPRSHHSLATVPAVLDLAAELARFPSVPAISLAVERDGERAIEDVAGAVDSSVVRFQAASISKTVTALVTLRLVEQGAFSLDDDILDLTGRRPAVARQWQPRVTVRVVLGHRGGFADDSGFPGYPVDREGALPSLDEILRGGPGVNSAPLVVAGVPGLQFRYSGAGYVLLQVLIEQVTGRPFADVAAELVLEPAGMVSACFAQPPPADDAAFATGHVGGAPIPGGSFVYPEHAAAGMWCTAVDLLGLHAAVTGFEPAELRTEMLRGLDGYGLGVTIGPDGRTVGHTGGNHGFLSWMVGSPDGRYRIGAMVNGDDSRVLHRVVGLAAQAIGWDAVPAPDADEPEPAALLAGILGTYSGDGHRAVLARGDTGPLLTIDDQPPLALTYVAPDLTAPGLVLTVRVATDATGRAMVIRQPGMALHLALEN